jgi:hypothetical protein
MSKIGLYTPDERRSILVFLVIVLILFSIYRFFGPLSRKLGTTREGLMAQSLSPLSDASESFHDTQHDIILPEPILTTNNYMAPGFCLTLSKAADSMAKPPSYKLGNSKSVNEAPHELYLGIRETSKAVYYAMKDIWDTSNYNAAIVLIAQSIFINISLFLLHDSYGNRTQLTGMHRKAILAWDR